MRNNRNGPVVHGFPQWLVNPMTAVTSVMDMSIGVLIAFRRTAAAGLIAGIVVALAATRALGTLLFGVAPFDLATFVAMSLAMFAVGLLASWVPARRAARVDPNVSLRNE